MPQDKITVVRLKQQDGQYGPQIPVGTKAENVQYDKFYSVKDALGNVKAPLQEQIDNIDTNAISNAVTDWLEDNPSAGLPTDKTLTIQNTAADAKAAGDLIKINNQTNGNTTKLHFNTTNNIVNVLTTDDINPNDVNDLKNIKIPYPALPNSKYGTNGQLLMSKGDGNTEWTDYASPAFNQVHDAMEQLLENNPSWRANIQDESLTESKFSNELKLKAIKDYVTPEMFHAVGNGETDDSVAINNMMASAALNNYGVIFPAGKVYKVSNKIDASQGPKVILMYGMIKSTYTYGPTLVIGKSGSSIINGTYLIRIVKSSYNNDDGSIGAELINLWNCNITLAHIQNFETGVKICGYSGGTQWSTFQINRIVNCSIGIELTNSGQSGWVNGNLFFGGLISSSVGEGLGIFITSDNEMNPYYNNSNIFREIALENLKCCISLQYADRNRFKNMRLEENDNHEKTIVIKNNRSSGNIIQSSYSQKNVIENIGTNLFITPTHQINNYFNTVLFESPDLFFDTAISEYNTSVYKSCPGIRFMVSGNPSRMPYSLGIKIDSNLYGNYMHLNNGFAVVTRINTARNKIFQVHCIRKEDANTNPVRGYIKMYAEDDTVITAANTKWSPPPYNSAYEMTLVTSTMSANLQNGFITSSEDCGDSFIVTVPENCAYVDIGLAAYNSNGSDVKGFIVKGEKAEEKTDIQQERYPRLVYAPTGNHNLYGTFVINGSSTAGKSGWVYSNRGWNEI